jgi:methyltransferase
MILSVVILGLVTLQRGGELLLARRNTRRLLARGAVETGAEHYPIMVGLHAAWLIGLWWFAWNRPADLVWLALYLVLEALRAWTIASLAGRWTTRIISLPGEPLVRRGPYRFFPHPNYVIVTAEIAVLPMVFHMWPYAALFTVLNASLLWIRIRAEDRALGRAPAEADELG